MIFGEKYLIKDKKETIAIVASFSDITNSHIVDLLSIFDFLDQNEGRCFCKLI